MLVRGLGSDLESSFEGLSALLAPDKYPRGISLDFDARRVAHGALQPLRASGEHLIKEILPHHKLVVVMFFHRTRFYDGCRRECKLSARTDQPQSCPWAARLKEKRVV